MSTPQHGVNSVPGRSARRVVVGHRAVLNVTFSVFTLGTFTTAPTRPIITRNNSRHLVRGHITRNNTSHLLRGHTITSGSSHLFDSTITTTARASPLFDSTITTTARASPLFDSTITTSNSSHLGNGLITRNNTRHLLRHHTI